MTDYIDREALRESLEQHFQTLNQKYGEERKWAEGYNDGLERAICDVIFAHAADVSPVKHATLVKSPKGYYCSNCGIFGGTESDEYCFCCGAKIDKNTDFSQEHFL